MLTPKAEFFKMWLAKVGSERLDIENNLGWSVISALNAADKKQLEVKAELDSKKREGKK